MELAQTKAQMHETMEMKDTEVQEIRKSCHSLKQENEELTQKVQKLEQTGEIYFYISLNLVSMNIA